MCYAYFEVKKLLSDLLAGKLDFTNAIKEREFYNNVGVISWKNGAWQFRGRMKFIPSYKHAEAEWYETHAIDEAFPSTLNVKSSVLQIYTSPSNHPRKV